MAPITHNQNQLPYLVPITPVTDANGKTILDGQADTADIICVSKARLTNFIAELSTAQMKEVDKGISISLELMHYYSNSVNKFNKLEQYVELVKADRNKNQDIVALIKKTIAENGFDEKSQRIIKEILDIG